MNSLFYGVQTFIADVSNDAYNPLMLKMLRMTYMYIFWMTDQINIFTAGPLLSKSILDLSLAC